MVNAGQRPTIRSGGHCYEDFYANNPNGTLIDMSLMNHVGDLPQDARYRVGVGATLGQAYQELYKLYNVTLPGGTCDSVGAGVISPGADTAWFHACTAQLRIG